MTTRLKNVFDIESFIQEIPSETSLYETLTASLNLNFYYFVQINIYFKQ